ncbi:M28 family peptidase [Brevibacillus ruminantium]|uniref:M28 family peptidase n=1 Tax=Brevibacillus ruminantium TaxID=2950604 RepID=A0ABY4WJ48_9BACL|nr:M28 family peptidase [Brevibacillus ruminantium]USG67122.1 M28 family peptidase [Brevibacillus ruminantium]
MNEERKQLWGEVSPDSLMEFTRNIAREVRSSGSPEELRAFQYAKEKLEEFGFSPELHFSDAYISLPVSAAMTIDGISYSCITHAMGVSTGDAGISGELLYVGKGTPDDFRAQDVSGKIVLLDGIATGPSVDRAQAAGALAAIFINGAYTNEMIVSSVWGSPTTETIERLPKLTVVSCNYKDGEQIKHLMARNSDPVRAWIRAEVDTGWRKIPVLTGELKGTVEPDKFVLFSGHIDSWHYGAMDNGTANATMLEVARLMSKRKSQLKRTLRIAFWSGHSHGRYAGSAWYCDQNWEDLHDNGVLHINIDSVGAIGSDILTENNCMAETKDLAGVSIRDIAGQVFEGSRFSRAGDQSFWGTGIPSLLMGLSEQPPSDAPEAQAFAQLFGGGKTGGYGWWWHTTEDTIDKIDPANLARDCRIYADIVYQACTAAVVPINQIEAVKEIRHALEAYQQKAGGALPLALSVNRARELQERLVELYELVSSASLPDEAAVIVNSGIMRLSRILVPLNYLSGDCFHHDPPIKPVCIPLLEKINQLAKAEPGSDLSYMLITELTRNTNKVNYALREAEKEAASTLAQLKQQING